MEEGQAYRMMPASDRVPAFVIQERRGLWKEKRKQVNSCCA